MENPDVCSICRRQLDYPRTNLSARQPKILETFAHLWGTDDLIASFDGINVTQPINKETGRTDVEPNDPWPRKAHTTPKGTLRGG